MECGHQAHSKFLQKLQNLTKIQFFCKIWNQLFCHKKLFYRSKTSTNGFKKCFYAKKVLGVFFEKSNIFSYIRTFSALMYWNQLKTVNFSVFVLGSPRELYRTLTKFLSFLGPCTQLNIFLGAFTSSLFLEFDQYGRLETKQSHSKSQKFLPYCVEILKITKNFWILLR